MPLMALRQGDRPSADHFAELDATRPGLSASDLVSAPRSSSERPLNPRWWVRSIARTPHPTGSPDPRSSPEVSVPQSGLPQDRPNPRSGVAVLSEQLQAGVDQPSGPLRNALIFGLTVVVPHRSLPGANIGSN